LHYVYKDLEETMVQQAKRIAVEEKEYFLFEE
jgi:hypothetical protein